MSEQKPLSMLTPQQWYRLEEMEMMYRHPTGQMMLVLYLSLLQLNDEQIAKVMHNRHKQYLRRRLTSLLLYHFAQTVRREHTCN